MDFKKLLLTTVGCVSFLGAKQAAAFDPVACQSYKDWADEIRIELRDFQNVLEQLRFQERKLTESWNFEVNRPLVLSRQNEGLRRDIPKYKENERALLDKARINKEAAIAKDIEAEAHEKAGRIKEAQWARKKAREHREWAQKNEVEAGKVGARAATAEGVIAANEAEINEIQNTPPSQADIERQLTDVREKLSDERRLRERVVKRLEFADNTYILCQNYYSLKEIYDALPEDCKNRRP